MLRARLALLLLVPLGFASCGRADRPAPARPVAPAASAAAPPGPPAAQIVFGRAHGCALPGDGRVRCWGENDKGQLGRPSDGTAVAQGPGEVPGLGGVVQIAAGADATCALDAAGRVLCWGHHDWGDRPGPGGKGGAPAPIEGLGPAVSVALGYGDYGCAALRTGEVACWGQDQHGRLGTGGSAARGVAPRAVAGVAGAVQVAAGLYFACARLRSGGVTCWGDNRAGNLGNGERSGKTAPVAVAGVDDAVDLSASIHHACVARRSGRVTCWGAGRHGELGGKGEAVKHGPFTPPEVGDAERVAAGHQLTCALRKGGRVRCWGATGEGQTGTGASRLVPNAEPVAADVPGVEGASAVGASPRTACALKDRELLCWGANSHGLLGQGGASEVRRPVPVPLAGPAADVVAGRRASCALLKDGRVQCWGEGPSLLLRLNETRKPSLAQPEVVAGLDGVKALLTDDKHLCAYREHEQDPRCLVMGVFPYASGPGGNDPLCRPTLAKGLGRLTSMTRSPLDGWAIGTRPDGKAVAFALEPQRPPSGAGWTLEPRPKPVKGAPIATRVAGVRGSDEPHYYCSISPGRNVACFEARGGVNDVPEISGKVEVVDGLNEVVGLSVAGDRACAVRARGEVACWQRPAPPPDGAAPAARARAIEGLEPAAEVSLDSTSGHHVCALAKGGKVYCWSDLVGDPSGLLCTGAAGEQKAPAACPGVDDGVKLTAGDAHACVLRKNGGVSCWGDNLSGAVGPGGVARSEAPVKTAL
jgi:alpha-tubulin suppressor-like RCC1 family protein